MFDLFQVKLVILLQEPSFDCFFPRDPVFSIYLWLIIFTECKQDVRPSADMSSLQGLGPVYRPRSSLQGLVQFTGPMSSLQGLGPVYRA